MIVEIMNLIVSIFAIAISFFSLFVSLRTERKNRAAELVVKVGEYCEMKDDTYLQSVVIRNNSSGEFKDVFVFLVPHEDHTYVNKSRFIYIKKLDNLSIAINREAYKYVNSIIDEEKLTIKSYDLGMHKRTGVVLIFKDNQGRGWFKDTDNKLYPIKNVISLLVQAGLPLPGYKDV